MAYQIRILLTFMLGVSFVNTKAQRLTVSVEKGIDIPVNLVSRNLILGSDFVDTSLTTGSISKVKTFDRVGLFEIDGYSFLADPNDSISLTYENAERKYIITGGRHPGNYTIYSEIQKFPIPFERYNKTEDNYIEYLSAVDSVTNIRLTVLDKAKNAQEISIPVYQYMSCYIHSAYIQAALYYWKSKTLLRTFPEIAGKVTPILELSQFTSITRMDNMMQAMAACMYIIAYERRKDSVNYMVNSVTLVFDQFKAQPRSCLLHYLLINGGFLAKIQPDQAEDIVHKLNALNSQDAYVSDIVMRYQAIALKGRKLTESLLSASDLLDKVGREITLAELLDQNKGKRFVFVFWASWCGPCLAEIPVVKTMEKNAATKNTMFIYLSLDHEEAKWHAALTKNDLHGNQYLMMGDFQSSVCQFLLVSSIPRHVIIDDQFTIANPNARLVDFSKL